jgi:periplasmic divalent cation tolerance protein
MAVRNERRGRAGRPRGAGRPMAGVPGLPGVHPVLIVSAYPGRAAAERAARALVRARVLACATVTGAGKAFYRWGGKDRAHPTALLWGKTLAPRARAALEAIRLAHPDTVPEILILPVRGGHAPYLEWLAGEVR